MPLLVANLFLLTNPSEAVNFSLSPFNEVLVKKYCNFVMNHEKPSKLNGLLVTVLYFEL